MKRGWLLALCAVLAGCGDAGEVYPIAQKDVVARLKATSTPPGVFGSAAPYASVSQDRDGNVVWTLSKQGKKLMRFVATIQPVDPANTRVVVTVLGPNDDPEDPANVRLAEHGEITAFYRDAMTEQVDATLEGREFEFSRIAGSMMRATAANIGSIGDQMDQAAAQSRKRVAEYEAQQGYNPESSEAWSDTDTYDPSYGQPTDDGSSY